KHKDPHSFPTRRSSDLKYSDLYQSKAVSEEAKGEKRLQAQNSLIEWENLKQTLKMQKSQLQQELISAKNQLSSFKNNHNEHNLRDRKSTRLNSSHVSIS